MLSSWSKFCVSITLLGFVPTGSFRFVFVPGRLVEANLSFGDDVWNGYLGSMFKLDIWHVLTVECRWVGKLVYGVCKYQSNVIDTSAGNLQSGCNWLHVRN